MSKLFKVEKDLTLQQLFSYFSNIIGQDYVSADSIKAVRRCAFGLSDLVYYTLFHFP